MSLLGGKTKKVTTYGKKSTRIIPIHTDLSPDRPKNPFRSHLSSEYLASPLHPKRPPLQAKPSQQIIAPCESDNAVSDSLKPSKTTPIHSGAIAVTKSVASFKCVSSTTPTPVKPSRLTGRGRSKTPTGDVDEYVPRPRPRKVGRPRNVVIPRSPRISLSPQSRRLPSTSPQLEVVPPPRRRPTLAAAVGTVSRVTVLSDAEDLSNRLGDVSLTADTVPKEHDEIQTADDMAKLIAACSIATSQPFNSIFSSPELLALIPDAASDTEPILTKIGEASYSEVFSLSSGIGKTGVVVKVIPLEDTTAQSANDDTNTELPYCSEARDVLREIEITRHMSLIPGGGFVDFLGAFVVHGTYPITLLEEWDTFDSKSSNGSGNPRPDGFRISQQYALVVLTNGGIDLETYQFELSRGWVQAAAVFWQVADALARAESWTQFEHRDLHEGQILISHCDTGIPAPVTNYLDTHQTAVCATVIDFGLSRLDLPNRGPISTQLPAEVYEGVGDQWNVYRTMRERVQRGVIGKDDSIDPWILFHPITNVLWLHYLVHRLLNSTRTLRKPYTRSQPLIAPPHSKLTGIKHGAGLEKEIVRVRAELAYCMLNDIDVTLGASLGIAAKRVAARGGKSSAKGESGHNSMSSARDIVEWGKAKGWIS